MRRLTCDDDFDEIVLIYVLLEDQSHLFPVDPVAHSGGFVLCTFEILVESCNTSLIYDREAVTHFLYVPSIVSVVCEHHRSSCSSHSSRLEII